MVEQIFEQDQQPRRMYYLSGSYKKREDLQRMMTVIARRTGWHCTSTWLTKNMEDELPAVCAAIDLRDVERAEAMVMVGGAVSPGKYVELGFALIYRKPVLYIPAEGGPEHRSAFLAMPNVIHVKNEYHAADYLRYVL